MSEDFDIKHRDKILETIDQLRRRKARPDSPRICTYMMRKYSVHWKDTRADLQKCIDKQYVYKVEYKGNISYRNASKFKSRSKFIDELLKTQGVDNDDKKMSGTFTEILTSSLSELICQEPDYLELGVPSKMLLSTIITKSEVKYNKKNLLGLIQKEVDNGRLVKLENGNFAPGNLQSESADERSDSNDYMIFDEELISKKSYDDDKTKTKGKRKSDDNASENLGLRVGSRRKLAKKVFDPSDNNLPKRRRGGGKSSSGTSGGYSKKSPTRSSSSASNNTSKSHDSSLDNLINAKDMCCVCYQKVDSINKTVACKDCPHIAHKKCLNEKVLKLLEEIKFSWQCINCRVCVICLTKKSFQKTIACIDCLDAYHISCLNEGTTNDKVNPKKWICNKCVLKRKNNSKKYSTNKSDKIKIITHTTHDSFTSSRGEQKDSLTKSVAVAPTIAQSGVVQKVENKSVNDNDDEMKTNYDPSIPDASKWTYNDVYHYFNKYYPREAIVFKDQEIDGHSLLLLKRNDVLNSLNLKLGPALKIYRHVLKLQLRRDDPKLGWF